MDVTASKPHFLFAKLVKKQCTAEQNAKDDDENNNEYLLSVLAQSKSKRIAMAEIGELHHGRCNITREANPTQMTFF